MTAMCWWSGSSIASGNRLPIWCNTVKELSDRQDRPAGSDWKGRSDRHHDCVRSHGVRNLRHLGRVRAGSDPRAHHGGSRLRESARSQGRTKIRAHQSSGASRASRHGPARYFSFQISARNSASSTSLSTDMSGSTKGELRDHGSEFSGLRAEQLVSFRRLSHLRASSEN